MYTEEEQAIHFVEKAFAGQKRIKEDIPLSFHSIMVGYMLKDSGYNKEIILTGFLHDIIEDTEYTYEDIVRLFGETIASNVLKVSEDTTITDWTKRKEEFFNRMTSWSKEIFLVELADKLQNLLSDYNEWKEKGPEGLQTLSTTYEMNKWYYTTMQKKFHENISNEPLLQRYDELITLYFGD